MNIRYATKRPTVKRNNTVPIILALLCSDKHPPHFSDAIFAALDAADFGVAFKWVVPLVWKSLTQPHSVVTKEQGMVRRKLL